MGRNKAFFLDRDGVMIEEKNYLADPANVCLCPGCAEALRKIAAAGYRMIVTSNQSGIARGYFTFAEVAAVEKRIQELLLAEGAPLPPAAGGRESSAEPTARRGAETKSAKMRGAECGGRMGDAGGDRWGQCGNFPRGKAKRAGMLLDKPWRKTYNKCV